MQRLLRWAEFSFILVEFLKHASLIRESGIWRVEGLSGVYWSGYNVLINQSVNTDLVLMMKLFFWWPRRHNREPTDTNVLWRLRYSHQWYPNVQNLNSIKIPVKGTFPHQSSWKASLGHTEYFQKVTEYKKQWDSAFLKCCYEKDKMVLSKISGIDWNPYIL